ncbi:hypothetical protein G9A89_012071 [Geosiphon pyriformis]|nr:hypothetical protein G9A89_012071 [Geosiphon pyriformis]
MTLYLSLVFGLLVSEIVIFLFLILPFPSSWRRAMFRWVSDSPLLVKLQFWFKILFIFVFILFADSLNRIWKVEQESSLASDNHIHDVRTETNLHAKKFYNQRNMYLTGFTLFLSLILNRTYSLILDLLAAEEKLEEIKKQTSNQSKEHRRAIDNEGKLQKEIETLNKSLEDEKKKARDFDVLKKQASQQSEEYMRLAERYNELEKKLENHNEDKKFV